MINSIRAMHPFPRLYFWDAAFLFTKYSIPNPQIIFRTTIIKRYSIEPQLLRRFKIASTVNVIVTGYFFRNIFIIVSKIVSNCLSQWQFRNLSAISDLPNLYTLIFIKPHTIAWLNIKSLIKFILTLNLDINSSLRQ